jgi:IS5 family transposase
MSNKNRNSFSQSLFQMSLFDQLNLKDPLLILGAIIDWDFVCTLLSSFYSDLGRKPVNLRIYAGLIMLKYIYNLSDERVISEFNQNPYYQAFCGASSFQDEPPCHPSKLTTFRQTIGQAGAEVLLAASVFAFGLKAFDDIVIIDSTVQEKYTSYPNDKKLACDILKDCRAIASKENIKLERTFKKLETSLVKIINFSKNKKNNKSSDALVELKKIASSLVTHLQNKLHNNHISTYDERIHMFREILKQTKTSTNKTYSIYEPQVQCIAKGKTRPKYEFGSKVGFIISKSTGVILGAISFDGNPNDSKTIDISFEQLLRMYTQDCMPSAACGDLGYRVRKAFGQDALNLKIREIRIITPDLLKKITDEKERNILIALLKSRCKIEPIIGHLKTDYRLYKNYLHNVVGDKINCIFSAMAFNLKKVINTILDGNNTKFLVATYATTIAYKIRMLESNLMNNSNAKVKLEANKKFDGYENKLF